MMKAVVALALSCLVVACGHKEESRSLSRPVQSVVVGTARDTVLAVYSGEVRARHETPLAFRVPGKVVSRSVDMGQTVYAGQELMRLDGIDLSLGADSAHAQLAAALAEKQLALAELERYRGLLSKHFVSQAAFDLKKASADAASAKVAALAAQENVSRNQASYVVLRAEQAGVISQVLAEPGQVVAAGQAVLRLARPEEKEVAISIPESRMAELKHSRKTEITLWAREGSQTFVGKMRELAPVADPLTRTYAARVSIANADQDLLLGMTANVRFLAAQGQASTPLPLTAIFQQEGKPAVWVVGQDMKLSLRPVTIERYTEDSARISAGLKAGERVVSAGVHKLVAGEVVRLLGEAR